MQSAFGVSKFIEKFHEIGTYADIKVYPRARSVCTNEIIAAVA